MDALMKFDFELILRMNLQASEHLVQLGRHRYFKYVDYSIYFSKSKVLCKYDSFIRSLMSSASSDEIMLHEFHH